MSKDLGFEKIMMVGDTLEIVLALQRERSYKSSYKHLIDDAKIILNDF